MSKYIVTGGAGFIGSNLAKKLKSTGSDVVIVDNFMTGSMENLTECDFEVLKDTEKINEVKGVDAIFHLGIPSSSPMYRNNRHLLGKAISDFITIFEYAKEHNIKVVYASSSSVYNGNKPPFREDMTIFPTDFYTEGRYAMERIARVYFDFYGVKSIGLRPFSVYGDNEKSKGKYANLVSQIFWAKEKGENFDVYNKGAALRDLVHVDDAVRAFIMAMDTDFGYEIFNLGTGKGYTINEIIKAIGLKNYKYVDNPLKNYVNETLADTKKAEEKLKFKTEIDVMDYIREKNKGAA